MTALYRGLRWLMPRLSPVLGLISLSKLLDLTLAEVVAATAVTASYLYGWKVLWLVILLAAAYTTYFSIRHKDIPLTILATDVDIYLDDPSGSEARVVRRQTLRPNREDVTGFHRKFWPDKINPKARIPRESIRMDIGHCANELMIEGTPRGWEVIQKFEPIPMNLLNFIPVYHKALNTTERGDQIRILDSFTNDQEQYDFLVPAMYSHIEVKIRVWFHRENCPDVSDCQASRMSKHGIIPLKLRPISNDPARLTGVELSLKKPVPGDTYRVRWKYPTSPASLVPGVGP